MPQGFDEAIGAKEVRYVDKTELDEDSRRELNHKLSVLHGYTFNGRMARANRVFVTVEYFAPCSIRTTTLFTWNRAGTRKSAAWFFA
jgi:hypothetical protein